MKSMRFMRDDMGLSQIELSQATRIPRWKIQLHEQGVMFMSQEEEKLIIELWRETNARQLNLESEEGDCGN